jgi:hypothetical protein
MVAVCATRGKSFHGREGRRGTKMKREDVLFYTTRVAVNIYGAKQRNVLVGRQRDTKRLVFLFFCSRVPQNLTINS